MNFGGAIKAMKEGCIVSREGWNGNWGNMSFIYLQRWAMKGMPVKYEPCIIIRTSDDKSQPGWMPTMADMLAEDWVLNSQTPQMFNNEVDPESEEYNNE